MFYFFSSYLLVWIVLFAYLWFLGRKVSKIEAKLKALEKRTYRHL